MVSKISQPVHFALKEKRGTVIQHHILIYKNLDSQRDTTSNFFCSNTDEVFFSNYSFNINIFSLIKSFTFLSLAFLMFFKITFDSISALIPTFFRTVLFLCFKFQLQNLNVTRIVVHCMKSKY